MRDTSSAKISKLVKDIGVHASAQSPHEAADLAEVILLATPWSAVKEAIASLGDLHGKLLIDGTNPSKPDLSRLEVGFSTSGGEMVQSWAMDAFAFKAFNTVGFSIMEDPVLEGRKTVMFYGGDDWRGREKVKELILDVGFEPLYVGPLPLCSLAGAPGTALDPVGVQTWNGPRPWLWNSKKQVSEA